jgi:cell division protein FtsB
VGGHAVTLRILYPPAAGRLAEATGDKNRFLSRDPLGGVVRASLLVPVVCVAFFGLAVSDDDSGLFTWLRLRADLEASQIRIAKVQAEIERLERVVADLGDDDFAIEGAIREDLEFARPGETVVRFVRPGVHPVSRLRRVE